MARFAVRDSYSDAVANALSFADRRSQIDRKRKYARVGSAETLSPAAGAGRDEVLSRGTKERPVSERMLTICHAADLCLGAIPADWTTLPEDPALREVLLDAPFIAFRSLVDGLLERPPDAVILSGTLFDAPQPDVCSWLRFQKEIGRLADAGCVAVIAPTRPDGNHGERRSRDDDAAATGTAAGEPPDPFEELAAQCDRVVLLDPGAAAELRFDGAPHILRVRWESAASCGNASVLGGARSAPSTGGGDSEAFDVVLMAGADWDAAAVDPATEPQEPAGHAEETQWQAAVRPSAPAKCDYLGVFGKTRHRSAAREYRCVQFLTALQPMSFGGRAGYAATIEWDGAQPTVLRRLYTAPLRWVFLRSRVEPSDDPLRLAESFAAQLQPCNVHANERLWLCRCMCEGHADELAGLVQPDFLTQLHHALRQRAEAREHGIPCVFETELRPLPGLAAGPRARDQAAVAAIEQFFASLRQDDAAHDEVLAAFAASLADTAMTAEEAETCRRLVGAAHTAECLSRAELFAHAWLKQAAASGEAAFGAGSEAAVRAASGGEAASGADPAAA